MKYVSTVKWRDLTDRHLYGEGEPFPYDGRDISKQRIAELSGTQNKAGFALIKALPVPVEEIPIQEEETPKKATRGRKKAV